MQIQANELTNEVDAFLFWVGSQYLRKLVLSCRITALPGIVFGLKVHSEHFPQDVRDGSRRTIACSGARAARSFRLPLTPLRAPADA